MFGFDSGELLVIVVVTVVVVGPKDLPRVLYKIGQLMGKLRGFTQHFRTGIDAMVREVELEELQKKWAADNLRIMNEHPQFSETSEASTAASVEEVEAGQVPLAESSPSSDTSPMLPLETPQDVAHADPDAEEQKPSRPEAAA